MKHKNLILRLGVLIAGIAVPILLETKTACERGLLGFLRGPNAYIIIHGNSFDSNNTPAYIDLAIVYGLSTILISYFCFTIRRPNHDIVDRYVIPVILIFGLETVTFLVGLYLNFNRCFQF